MNAFDEGVEFSIRVSSEPGEWIPLKFIRIIDKDHNVPEISIGDKNNFWLRGYPVDNQVVISDVSSIRTNICCFNSTDSIQFRWLQTSEFRKDYVSDSARDTWSIDNIAIDLVSDKFQLSLLNESFDNDSPSQ